MCTAHAHLRNSRQWNWDGDIIVHDPIIQGTRRVLGTGHPYDVDIREFLVSKDNAIVRGALGRIVEALPANKRALFLSRRAGSFDFRVEVLKRFISREVRYVMRPDRFDAWLYPEETLAGGEGDCEDRAFLLASLMMAAGISGYCLRVVLGRVKRTSSGPAIDHVWVMYKNESGLWQCIEPLDHAPATGHERVSDDATYFYEPVYAFNDQHMWHVGEDVKDATFARYLGARKQTFQNVQRILRQYRPTFGYRIHLDIVSAAIDPAAFEAKLTDRMRAELIPWTEGAPSQVSDYLGEFAASVANVDITLFYNPLLHFDNGLITESRQLLDDNLSKGGLGDFARACHATADFYAHTSYAHFARKNATGNIAPCSIFDPNATGYGDQFEPLPEYATGVFSLGRFSTNGNVWHEPDKHNAASELSRRIISGRFGQSGDSKSLLERTQFYRAEYPWQGALPHHNEIAVDGGIRDSEHVLYDTDDAYAAQYRVRRGAATLATHALFQSWQPK